MRKSKVKEIKGRSGGLATAKKYGKKHFSALAKKRWAKKKDKK